ncbi:hypothetical protein AC578_7195 [Pseudocercospora eumusae]|uniref:Uncharacterized protein n=1 Tax=Pseudocercospora eumusae TaxID=321146 RepID=A0A139HWS4_9PEZI|nr:hypothetical protein AC578_7195 [Pseudocercospora eumusae]
MASPRADTTSHMHTTFAGICRHPIRHSSIPPDPAPQLDPAVPYCGDCTTSQHLMRECEEARQELAAADVDDQPTRQAARDRWHRAKLNLIEHEERQGGRSTAQELQREDSGAADEGQTPQEVQGSNGVQLPQGLRRTRSVRFDEKQKHRAEGQYRSRFDFHRSLPEYEPGQWADQTGAGYANTSDPYVENPELDESKEEEWEEYDSEDEQIRVSLMTDEELAAEGEKVDATIAILKKECE